MLNRCEVIGTRFPDIEDCVGKQCKGIPRSDSAFTGICTAILAGYYVHTAAKLDIKLCILKAQHTFTGHCSIQLVLLRLGAYAQDCELLICSLNLGSGRMITVRTTR